MDMDQVAVGRRLRELREAAGVTAEQAREAIGVSQPTYSRIETGGRPLKGAELLQLAALFGVRTGAITGHVAVAARACAAARTDGSASPMTVMRERLTAYLELDEYLTAKGIDQP